MKRFISEFREVPSHPEVTKKVINVMTTEYLKNGISVIVEQNMDRDDVEALKEIAEAQKADFFM